MSSYRSIRWSVLALACVALTACAKQEDEDVGASPERDTTAITTEVDTATGTWDTTSTSEVGPRQEPADTLPAPAQDVYDPEVGPRQERPDTLGPGQEDMDSSGYDPDVGPRQEAPDTLTVPEDDPR
jgi:hypothetical protein